MRAGATGVHDPLGDALVVEVRDLLAQVVVLQQRRAARPRLQRVVGVGQPEPLGGREVRTALGARVLRRPGGLAGRRHRLRRPLVRLGRRRLARRRRLLQRGRFGRRHTRYGGRGHLLLRLRCCAVAGRVSSSHDAPLLGQVVNSSPTPSPAGPRPLLRGETAAAPAHRGRGGWDPPYAARLSAPDDQREVTTRSFSTQCVMVLPLTSRGPFLPRLARRCSSSSVSVWDCSGGR